MKLKFFILISTSLATVGLIGLLPSAFGHSLEPQINIKEAQPLMGNLGSSKGASGEWIYNQALVQQGEATQNIQFLPVEVATLPTQSNQPHLVGEITRYINTVGGVFLPSVFIGYILGELRSIKYRVHQVDVQHSRAIGVFPNREAAGKALDKLVLSGFLLEKVFLIGKELAFNEQSVDVEIMSALVNQARLGAMSRTATGLRKGLSIGKVSGGLIGFLLGLDILAQLGVSQIALAPAVGFTLLCGIIFTVAGGIIGALIGMKMTKKQVMEYGKRVANGNYLLIVNGTKSEIKRAEFLINNSDFSII